MARCLCVAPDSSLSLVAYDQCQVRQASARCMYLAPDTSLTWRRMINASCVSLWYPPSSLLRRYGLVKVTPDHTWLALSPA